jgi:predicted SprT family Zn-dependent metalloprotease
VAGTNVFVTKLIAVRAEAIMLMEEFDLPEDGWHFQFSNHKTYLGMCYHQKKVIALSQHFILKSPDEVITDTLLHEIAHALVGPGHGHDGVWRHKAISIGCDGNRTCDEGVSTAKPNYRIQCPNEYCGWSADRFRMKRRNFGSTCPKCGTVVEIYQIKRG